MKFSNLKCIGALLFYIVCLTISPQTFPDESRSELRCGWFENSSPSNAFLTDKDGEWTVSMQGGHEAKGDWPKFNKIDWVNTGIGSYGYGCTCLKVISNKEEMEIIEIISANTKALLVCRRDKALREPTQ